MRREARYTRELCQLPTPNDPTPNALLELVEKRLRATRRNESAKVRRWSFRRTAHFSGPAVVNQRLLRETIYRCGVRGRSDTSGRLQARHPTRHDPRAAAGSALAAVSSRISALGFGLWAPGSRLSLGSGLSAVGSRQSVLEPRAPTPACGSPTR